MTKLTVWEKELEILSHNRKSLISSRTVAEIFGKYHFHVVRNIESAIVSISKAEERSKCLDNTNFAVVNFIKNVYKDSNNRSRTEYLLTRDGLTFIVMGFTGEKALEFQIAYIRKFNEMKQRITALKPPREEYIKFAQSIIKDYEETNDK